MNNAGDLGLLRNDFRNVDPIGKIRDGVAQGETIGMVWEKGTVIIQPGPIGAPKGELNGLIAIKYNDGLTELF